MMKDVNTILFYYLVGTTIIVVGYFAPFSNTIIPYALYTLGGLYIAYGLFRGTLLLMRTKRKSAFTIYREATEKQNTIKPQVKHAIATSSLKRS